MNAIIVLFRRLFGREKSITQITRPMEKIVRDLQAYADQQDDVSSQSEAKAAELKERARAGRSEAAAAKSLAGNYQSLVSRPVI